MVTQTEAMEHYVDDQSPANWMGSYSEGNSNIDPSWVEVTAPPPLHAEQQATSVDEAGVAVWTSFP